MNCPRCNTIMFYESFDGGEFIASCNMCGYYSARVIDCFVGNTPIIRPILHEPLGVVISKKGNFQYYSDAQLQQLIEKHDPIAYTFLNSNKRWMYHDICTGITTPFKRLKLSNVY